MRAFVALEVPENQVLDSLKSMQRELARTGADLKAVERENLHFTIKFLGEINDAQAADADRRLKALTLRSTVAEIRGVGAFPSPSRPSVVWAGVARGHEEPVVAIASAVAGALEGIGKRDDRPFTAHLTLARVKSARNLPSLSAAIRSNAEKSFGSSNLSTLKLKSSQLTSRGPVYSDIGVYLLT